VLLLLLLSLKSSSGPSAALLAMPWSWLGAWPPVLLLLSVADAVEETWVESVAEALLLM
jgi:hypothetical protein